jgi:hypothetical protein
MKVLVFWADPRTVPWSFEALEALREAVGPSATGCILDIYRSIVARLPDSYRVFRTPKFVRLVLEVIEDSAFRIRKKAAKLLLVFLDQVGGRGDMGIMRDIFLRSADLLLAFLDIAPEAAFIALRIFAEFDHYRVLIFDPAQEPDCHFFAWLLEWPGDDQEIALPEMCELVQAWQQRCQKEMSLAF